MRNASLQAIRSRVERLAEAWKRDAQELLFIRWRTPYDNCPGCGYDLDAHARNEALPKSATTAPDSAPQRVIFYWWPGTLKTCPRCGGELP